MTANIINGKAIADARIDALKITITERQKNGLRAPGLAVILVGDDPASHIYVNRKREACQRVGIQSFFHPLPAHTDQATLLTLIDAINNDPHVDGILLQLPLPRHLNQEIIIDAISPQKDVDGFHAYNLGKLVRRHPYLRPCTPKGIMTLLTHINESPHGKHAVVVGASTIVGRPMMLELLMAGSTVTICHRATKDLSHHIQQADILITATGQPGLVPGHWIKDGAILFDVGITRLPNGQLTGDIVFDEARERAKWITPVPGGVGPMTVATLLENTLDAQMACT